MRARDYQIELYVIATDKEISWKATIARGNTLKESVEITLYVDISHHDKVVESLPQTLSKLALSDDLFDDIVIMNRDQQILYQKTSSPEKDPGEILKNALHSWEGVRREEYSQNLDKMIARATAEIVQEQRSDMRVFRSSRHRSR